VERVVGAGAQSAEKVVSAGRAGAQKGQAIVAANKCPNNPESLGRCFTYFDLRCNFHIAPAQLQLMVLLPLLIGQMLLFQYLRQVEGKLNH
jgi:hypothetical protein